MSEKLLWKYMFVSSCHHHQLLSLPLSLSRATPSLPPLGGIGSVAYGRLHVASPVMLNATARCLSDVRERKVASSALLSFSNEKTAELAATRQRRSAAVLGARRSILPHEHRGAEGREVGERGESRKLFIQRQHKAHRCRGGKPLDKGRALTSSLVRNRSLQLVQLSKIVPEALWTMP